MGNPQLSVPTWCRTDVWHYEPPACPLLTPPRVWILASEPSDSSSLPLEVGFVIPIMQVRKSRFREG